MLTREEKKNYLNRYCKLVKECDLLELDLIELRIKFENTKSMSYDDMPKGGNKKSIEDYIDEILNLEKLLLETKKEALRVYTQIEILINRVEDDIQRLILRLRYQRGKHWEDIAKELHYSYQHILRIHNLAIKKLKL